jgi:hypothetical protein
MADMRFTLLTDGPSDRALLYVLDWLVQLRTSTPFESRWADLRPLSRPPEALPDKIVAALDLYPCDLLFVHRDAENQPLDFRTAEIRAALDLLEIDPPAVCVVPVRMTEAWLPIDEGALRKAAGRPKGKNPLHLPAVRQIEQIPDPMERLYGLFREASGLGGRRIK